MKMFVFYAFLGWLLEICVVSSHQKKFTNNHYLLLPFCPMYGLASISIVMFTQNMNNVFLIFISAAVISIIFEYITAYLLENIYKVRWWNYERKKLELHGRIYLINTLWFGLLGLIIHYIDPHLYKIINPLYSPYIFLILILIDSLISAYYTYKITHKKIFKDNFISSYIRHKINENLRLN